MSGHLIAIDGVSPSVDETAYVAPNATLTGNVEMGPESSVWFGAVIRGDLEPVRVGARTNIQDRCIVHVDAGIPTTLGEGVSIGHSAVVHGCTVGDGSLIGVRAVLLDRVVIEDLAMIAAGAVVTTDTRVPTRQLWGGVPARHLRDLTDEDLARMARAAEHYVEHARVYPRLTVLGA